jgi:hypothetical protein
MEKKIFVERETFEYKGSTYFSYFIKGEIRGKEVRIAVVPPDKGGYVVLDIVFDSDMACELALKPYEIKDDKGNVMTGNTYSVISVDENGLVYECPIKPAKSSDKALLNMLIR